MNQLFGPMSRSYEPDGKAPAPDELVTSNTDCLRFLRSPLHITDGMEPGIFSAPVGLQECDRRGLPFPRIGAGSREVPRQSRVATGMSSMTDHGAITISAKDAVQL